MAPVVRLVQQTLTAMQQRLAPDAKKLKEKKDMIGLKVYVIPVMERGQLKLLAEHAVDMDLAVFQMVVSRVLIAEAPVVRQKHVVAAMAVVTEKHIAADAV